MYQNNGLCVNIFGTWLLILQGLGNSELQISSCIWKSNLFYYLEKLICCMKYTNISDISERMTHKLAKKLVQVHLQQSGCFCFPQTPKQQQNSRPWRDHRHLLPLHLPAPFALSPPFPSTSARTQILPVAPLLPKADIKTCQLLTQ